jgi:pimeloyl-ACP methyl ester carboxylesterase
MTPIIFIHGAGGSLHLWYNQLKMQLTGYCHVAVDLPGHARSEGRGHQEIQAYADLIADFIYNLGYTHPVLAGHSMGGAITQTVAVTHPKLLQAIILVGTGARLRVAPDVLTRARKGASFAEYAYAPQTSTSVKQEAEKEFGLTSPEVRYHDFLACDRFDLMERVQEIQIPTLIICGQEDKLTPIKYAMYLQEQMPNARLETIPQAGHMVMWEQPEACNRIIKDFLRR